MYAVIKSGGKQFRVKTGDVLKLETLPEAVGETVQFKEVVAIGEGASLTVGKPFVEGSNVLGKVLSHGRHKKIRIIKFRRRKHYMKTQGHRQNYTQVEITQVS